MISLRKSGHWRQIHLLASKHQGWIPLKPANTASGQHDVARADSVRLRALLGSFEPLPKELQCRIEYPTRKRIASLHRTLHRPFVKNVGHPASERAARALRVVPPHVIVDELLHFIILRLSHTEAGHHVLFDPAVQGLIDEIVGGLAGAGTRVRQALLVDNLVANFRDIDAALIGEDGANIAEPPLWAHNHFELDPLYRVNRPLQSFIVDVASSAPSSTIGNENFWKRGRPGQGIKKENERKHRGDRWNECLSKLA